MQISSLKTELENVKRPNAILNIRTSTMHADPRAPLFSRLALLADGYGTHRTW